MIIVIPVSHLKVLMESIVMTTHGAVDTLGRRFTLSTIEAGALRSAAVAALSIATGATVIPGDEQIDVEAPRQNVGILHVNMRG